MTILLSTQQTAIVQHAIAETDGEIQWFPDHIRGGAQTKMLQSLVTKDLAHRVDDRWFLTASCYELMDLPVPSHLETVVIDVPVFVKAAKTSVAKPSKQQIIIDLLNRPEGATLSEIMTATGWQQHTVRGAISGALKKRLGYEIESIKTSGSDRTYRILKTSDESS